MPGKGFKVGGHLGCRSCSGFDQVAGMGVCSPAVIHQPTS